MFETIHVVQPFNRQGGGLMPGHARQYRTGEDAARWAGVLAGDHAGVVAYSMDIDEEGGDYSAPRVLASYGDVPEME